MYVLNLPMMQTLALFSKELAASLLSVEDGRTVASAVLISSRYFVQKTASTKCKSCKILKNKFCFMLIWIYSLKKRGDLNWISVVFVSVAFIAPVFRVALCYRSLSFFYSGKKSTYLRVTLRQQNSNERKANIGLYVLYYRQAVCKKCLNKACFIYEKEFWTWQRKWNNRSFELKFITLCRAPLMCFFQERNKKTFNMNSLLYFLCDIFSVFYKHPSVTIG